MSFDIFQIATLFVIITYTIITYRLLSTQKIQSFETAFFTMLDHHTKILSSIILNVNERRGTKRRLEGIEVFAHLRIVFNSLYKLANTFKISEKKQLFTILMDFDFNADELVIFYNKVPRKNKDEINKKDYFESFILYAYNFMFDKYFDQLGHYFRHLYNILKYVAHNEKKIKKIGDAEFYAGLVQAMLCSSELFLLFYDGIKFPKMKEYITYYNLIENLAVEDLADIEHKMLYPVNMKSRKDQIAK